MMLHEANALVIFSCCRLILRFLDNRYYINPHMILRECMIIQQCMSFYEMNGSSSLTGGLCS